jgi:hypothetical protein
MNINMTPEQFKVITSVVFEYYMTDDIDAKLRKMLTIEQFRGRKSRQFSEERISMIVSIFRLNYFGS